MQITALTLQTLGSLLIAYIAIRVHSKVGKSKMIDGRVILEIKHEKIVGIFGAILMIIGYILNLILILNK